jgi:hypothetical protein
MVLPQRRHPDGQADARLWPRQIHPERLLGVVHPRLEVSVSLMPFMMEGLKLTGI